MSKDRENKVVSLNDYRPARDRWEIEAREEDNKEPIEVDLSEVSIDKLMDDLRKTDLIEQQLTDSGLSQEEKEYLTATIMHMVSLIEENTRSMVRDTLKDLEEDNDTQGEE
jgi:hypothetical protein|tara:strand:+ start:411 stop:743 length:333 start_codon:yes stop_codon:yes gene_type:complete